MESSKKKTMPQVKPEVEAFARIKVLGIGGSGKNAVNHMINSKVRGVDFIAINTDAQDLHHSLPKRKIHIGKNVTKGLGAGMNPDIGKRAAEETKEEIQEALKGADMVFVAGGMGGGTFTGAGPVVARIAKEMNILTIAVITKPFTFEGQQRSRNAEVGLEELRKAVDAIIVIPNDKILATINKETTAKSAFEMCDEVLKQAVEGISDLITSPGYINVDFADIKAILENAGTALMGVGTATGEKRAEEAARSAINSPLIDVSIHGAKGVLFSVAGGDDVTMFEIQDAAKIITESIDPNAKVIFGTVRDQKLKKNEIRVTVIASGFPDVTLVNKRSLFHQEPAPVTVPTPTKEVPREKEKEIETPRVTDVRTAEKPVGKIYNSISPKPATERSEEKKTIPSTNDEESDDDDWGAIPAFLRRSKIK